jgi:ribosomal protein S18 acetylase RimI-like enzyme
LINNATEARRIEELLLNATQPLQQQQYDGWLLRLAPDDVKRASSVIPAYGSSLPVDAKLSHCGALFAQHGLPLVYRLTPFSQPADLDDALAERGYEVFERSLCMSAALDDVPPAARQDPRFELLPLDRWLDVAAELRGITRQRKQAEYQRLFESTLAGFSLIAWLGDRPVACGLTMIEDEYAGLFDICTAEELRGQGIGTALTAELLRLARRHGAQRAWLSVIDDNAPALHVYQKLGFKPVYDYWYRRRPA